MIEIESRIRFVALKIIRLSIIDIPLVGGLLLKIIGLLISIAYFTLAERKIMASLQRRSGPNVVGVLGLLQPIADGLKLLTKEMVIPSSANEMIFLCAPIIILILSLMSWIVIPFGEHTFDKDMLIPESLVSSLFETADGVKFIPQMPVMNLISNFKYSVLFILAISSFNVYSIIIAGWASNSKYAFLGALRSAAQMISYEVSIGLIILPVIMLSGSLNFFDIVAQQQITGWFIFPLLPCSIVFFISMLAETNRTPFDLTEAEAELVAGYNTEYSSIIFAMFFLAEYSNMILMSAIFSILFLGGWLLPPILTDIIGTYLNSSFIFSFKTIFMCFLFILVRATFPRYRYDQLMNICWKIFLPLSLTCLMVVALFILVFDCAPYIGEKLALGDS